MDKISKARRSANMRQIPSKNTKPELVVRSIVWSDGYRYRLHVGQLPGRPDLVFPGRRRIININGCFWHLHKQCREGRIPATRSAYWTEKLECNVLRDRLNARKLRAEGWLIMVVWECQLKDLVLLRRRIRHFLG